MSRRMRQSRLHFTLTPTVTYDSKVSGHEDDDHQCAATTHACGEVNVTLYFRNIIYLTLPAM